jgi:hypothetical protein
MKFILSPSGPALDLNSEELFFVELNRKKELSQPIPITREELRQKIHAGEEFRILYKSGCTWDIGTTIEKDHL